MIRRSKSRRDLYRWAATVITSRSFPGSALANAAMPGEVSQRPQSPVLIPGLDILNHDPNAKVRWQWTGEDCQIVTEETLQGRLQVHNNYAMKSNAERKHAQATDQSWLINLQS